MATLLQTQASDRRRFLYEQFLRCLDREENLIHYRLTWGLQWNLAGFTAFFLIETASQAPIKSIAELVLVIFGITSSFASAVGVFSAHNQAKHVINQINKRLDIKNHNWDDSEFIRPYGSPNSVHRIARWVSAFFPIVFIILWLLVLIYTHPLITNRP